MNVGFITYEQFYGKGNGSIGSTRIRADWLINHWQEAERYKIGKKYDVIIFQKVLWSEFARIYKGIKILDLCDPDFLHWAYRSKEMIEECDAVTTSTEELAIAIRKFTPKDKPVICIPDRVDMELHEKRKVHKGKAKSVVWFGYGQNMKMLEGVEPFLIKENLKLYVISNETYYPQRGMEKLKFENIKWEAKTINENIMIADFVLNPQSNKGHWKYKSNNKTITAWALGMPVAGNPDELKKFMDEEERKKEVEKRLKEIESDWKVELSVVEFKKLIGLINLNKFTKV